MSMRPIDVSGQKPVHGAQPGTAPILQWIAIADLVIDDGYQRDLKPGNWQAIRRIAHQFSWGCFSPVFVAPVEGGGYAVIDGQHRVHAAALCGIERVPCQVVPMDRASQARAFAAVNGLVTKVTTFQVFRAALTAGDRWAVEAHEVAARGGCTLMTANATSSDKKPGEIYAIRAFCRLIDQHGGDAVASALGVMRKAPGHAEHAELWEHGLLRATIVALAERPGFLAMDDASARLGDIDIWELIDRCDAARRRALRSGVPPTPRYVLLLSHLLDEIDATLPAKRMALPATASGAG